MSETYRDWSPNQSYMFPPTPQDWLPEDDLVYFILDTVATLDLMPIFTHYERELRGQPPFHPRMMVALLLYRPGVADHEGLEQGLGPMRQRPSRGQ